MIFIESDRYDPYWNLALEEYVFEQLDRSEEYFILWQNRNTIVVGKNQNTAEEINPAFVDEKGILVARRLSGGGAVYHDMGNLNYTIITDQKDNPDFAFRLYVTPVLSALEKLGVHAECVGRNDLTIGGRKFSGCSQYVKHGRIMHHGCIMLDSNLENVQNALRVNPAKFESKSIKSVRSRVTTINENAPRKISMEEFKEALKAEILGRSVLTEDKKAARTYTLTEEDIAAIEKRKKEKYETWEWNYGYFPAYSIQREKKFPAGLVQIGLDAQNGVIRRVKFSGDFFGNSDLSVLENELTGVPLDENLEHKLKELHLEEYIHGIDAGEIARLMR